MLERQETQAFIFAAGLGTRLKPLTDRMPKALVPISGKPLIDHVMENLQEQGIKEYIVNVHHFAEMLKEHLSCSKSKTTVKISDETDLLRETGGAIKHAEPLFNGQPFIVHNVDIISNCDIQGLMSKHKQRALATLLVSERKTQRYLLFDEKMRLAGWTNIATGEIKSPYGKIDPDKYRKLAFSGIHVVDPRICKLMESWPDKFSIIDFYLQKAKSEEIYGVVQEGLKMIDVGKINSLDEAEKLVQEIRNKK